MQTSTIATVAAIVAMVMIATVTPAAIEADLSSDGGSAVDVGVPEVTVGMTVQIGSLSVLIRTGQLESNVTTVEPMEIEAPLLTQFSI